MIDPKVAKPNTDTMTVLLPMILEVPANTAKPNKDAKNGRLAMTSNVN